MNALWMMAGEEGAYLVPDEQLILKRSGELLPFGMGCYDSCPQPEDWLALLAQSELVVLVAGQTLFDTGRLAQLPAAMPKVVLLLEEASPRVRGQLSALGIDAYASIGMAGEDFAAVLLKTCADKKALNALQDELKNYSSLAFTAMSSASEMGVVAHYAEKVQSTKELAELALLTFNCLRDLGLQAVMQFRFDKDISHYPLDAPESYKRLLQGALQSANRIVSHGRFLLFNFTQVQLLALDAPFEDEARYGRLRDLLAHIVSIAEARAKTLKVNTMLRAQQENSRTVMMLLEMASRDNRNSVKEIMTELSTELRAMAMSMDLNLEQEAQLLSLAEKALNSLESLQEATMAGEEYFRSLLEQLDDAASLLGEVKASARGADIAPAAAPLESNVELF